MRLHPPCVLLPGKCVDQFLHAQAEVTRKRHEIPGADSCFSAGHDLAEDSGVDAGLTGQFRRRQLPRIHPRAEHLRRSLITPHCRAPFRRAAAAAAAAAKKNNSGSSSSNGSSSSRPASSGNVVSGSGYFTHPCPGMTYQSSYFGEVRSFDPRPHKGNDYAAPTGTPTYAAAAGTVITAGWSNSAGNWVVISHGNGLVTKYMHHSSICVSAGQRVEKGQQIGYVGSTGYSTGAHLHFQVELNGTPVNPNNYM